MDRCLSDAGEIIAKPHVNWGHISAQRPERVSVYSSGENALLVNFADEVL